MSIEVMKRITRDDTEHGVEYYRADQVNALLAEQAQPVAHVLFRCDDDGLEPIMFYGPGTAPDPTTLKDRFTLRAVWLSPPPRQSEQAEQAQPVGVTQEQRRLIGVIADKIEDGTLFQTGIYSRKDLARFVRNMLDTTPPPHRPEQCMDHGECFGGKCIYPPRQPEGGAAVNG